MSSMCLGFIGDKALPKYSTKTNASFLEAVRNLVQEDKHQALDINTHFDELELFTDDEGTTSVFLTYNEDPSTAPKGLEWPDGIYRMLDNLIAAPRIELLEDLTYIDDCGNKRRSLHITGWPI